MILKKAQRLIAALFVTALFAVGCNEGGQAEDQNNTRDRNETGTATEETPPDEVDQERTTPVRDDATEEVELKGDTSEGR